MKIITHGRTFHADDVFAIAVATTLFPHAQVFRVTNAAAEPFQVGKDIMVDTGGAYVPEQGAYDHHQKSFHLEHDVPESFREIAKVWPLASFGLIWKHYGRQYVEQIVGTEYAAEVQEQVRLQLVVWLDATDNGVMTGPAIAPTMGGLISALNELQNGFETAVTTAKSFLKGLTVQALNRAKAAAEVLQQAKAQSGPVLELSNPADWLDTVFALNAGERNADPILHVIYPRSDGSFGVQAVATPEEPFKPRLPFPESWRGLQGEALQEVTGIPEAVFCHRGGYLLVTETLATAKQAAALTKFLLRK